MSHATSPSTQSPCGVARVTAVWGLARSSFYAARHRQAHPRQANKRGPKILSDPELLVEIQQLLAVPVFAGEGYRKIWARLRFAGVRTSKERALRLMREIIMREQSSPRLPIRCGEPMPRRHSLKRRAP